MKPSLLGMTLVATAVLTSGCASLDDRASRAPLTLVEIVELAKQGKAPTAIIDEIKNTRAVYDIAASQYAKLSKDGVPDPVLDFLQQGQLRMAERQGRREAYNDLWWNTRFGVGFGHASVWRGQWIPRPYTVWVNGKAQTKEF